MRKTGRFDALASALRAGRSACDAWDLAAAAIERAVVMRLLAERERNAREAERE